jgi:hypothetical protein
MTTYSLVYIPSEKYHQPTPGNSLFESIPVSNIDEAEKLLAAEYYTAYAKKCERNIKNTENSSFIREQYQDELNMMTKQFLEETPKEFLRLNNFKVITTQQN